MASSRWCSHCMWVALLLLCAMSSHAASHTLSHPDLVVEGDTERHERWMARHGRTYKDEAEKRHRLAIFKRNVEYIKSFNEAEGRKYKLGINKFADLSSEEFRATYFGFKYIPHAAPPKASAETFRYGNITDEDVPPEKDWREAGAVTTVKEQMQCGCCWAFSAVAAVEGITQIKAGNLVSLSEQELVDCDHSNRGCGGGDMKRAFQFIINSGGLATKEAYPYQGVDGSCNTEASASRQSPISSYNGVTQNDEQALLGAVAQQPVSVAIDATNFQLYQGGVFTGPCETNLNHAVAIVGYGTTEDGIKYWLAKNSWGESWGEAGYMKIQREVGDAQGLCGIAMDASYPVF